MKVSPHQANRLHDKRELGRSGLEVAPISMGTVALGMDYGLSGPMGASRLDDSAASVLLNRALDLGVNLFDTAPGYGCSEQVIGKFIGHRQDAIIATKVTIPRNSSGELLPSDATRKAILDSLLLSRKRLRREQLDLVQIHNATAEVLDRSDVTAALMEAKKSGLVRAIGASVYGEDCALKVIHSSIFDVIQVAYSILDQRMGATLFPAASAANVGVIIRSAFLKGVLTPRGQWLSRDLPELGKATQSIVDSVSQTWDNLPATALRFCAAASQHATVLIGVRDDQELATAVDAYSSGVLSDADLEKLRGFAIQDERLLNPVNWPQDIVVN